MRTLYLLGFIFFFSLSAKAQGDCIDCSLIDPFGICPAVFDPVCGCDGVTYGNDCLAITGAGVTSYTSGICPDYMASECSNLSGTDFGLCTAFLGYAVIDGECVGISGCSTIDSLGVDYAASFFDSPELCQSSCLCLDSMPNALAEHERLNVLIGSSPIEGEFQLYYNSSEPLDMEILDITGRTVKIGEVRSGNNVEVYGLKNGLYILLLKENGDAVHTSRLTIKQ